MDILWYILGVVAIIFGLGVSIGLHEIGHLVPAKLFGVKVTQYMLGFGFTLWSKKKGETEYGIKSFPLGGYVSMIGMYPPKNPDGPVREGNTGFLSSMVDEARDASHATITAGDEDRAFYRLSVFKRLTIMLGGPLMNLVLGFIFLAILVTGFGLPQTSTTLSVINECVIPVNSSETSCTEGATIAPGAAAGLQPGDHVVAFSGVQVESWEELSSLIAVTTTPTQITIERDGQTLDLDISPLVTERPVLDKNGQPIMTEDGQYVLEPKAFLGISPTTTRVPQNIAAVFPEALNNVQLITEAIIGLPQRLVEIATTLFSDTPRDPNGPISVVGVGLIAGEIVSHGDIDFAEKVAWLIGILASLNFMLFVFNLIPLPPLDGGHIAGGLWEMLKRGTAKLFGMKDPGPVDTAKLVPVTLVMFVVLLAMGVLLILADILKPISLL